MRTFNVSRHEFYKCDTSQPLPSRLFDLPAAYRACAAEPDDLVSVVNPFIVCMKGTEAGHGRCIALHGAVGKPGVHCTIYDRRPTPRREYRVWLDNGTPNPDC
jgi:Fe-S-cluster containining protein